MPSALVVGSTGVLLFRLGAEGGVVSEGIHRFSGSRSCRGEGDSRVGGLVGRTFPLGRCLGGGVVGRGVVSVCCRGNVVDGMARGAVGDCFRYGRSNGVGSFGLVGFGCW